MNKGNMAINGTFGRVWINEKLLALSKSFEAKVKIDYEDIGVPEQLTVDYKIVGIEITGTLTMTKIDSMMANLLADDVKKGIIPDVKIIAKLDDPASAGYERVEITGVVFDELTLMKFEHKKITEEEIPFKATGYSYLDKM